MFKGINLTKFSTPGLVSLLAGICAITGGLSFVTMIETNQAHSKAMDTLVMQQTPNDQGGKLFKKSMYDVLQASSIALTMEPGTPEYDAAVGVVSFRSKKLLDAMTSISVVSNASTAERGALTGILSGQLDIETTLAQSRLYHQQGDQKLALQTFLTAWNTLESNNGPIETAQAFSEEARERGAAEISADLTAGKSKLTTSIVLSLLMVAAIIGAQVLISRRQKTGVSVWLALAAIVTMANTVQWTMNYYTVQATIEKTSPALVLQMQRAAEYGSLVSALGAATAVQQLDPVAGSARIDAKIPKLAGFYNSNGRDSVQLTCLSQSFLDRVPQGDSCPVTNGVLIDLLPLNRTDLPGEWEYLSGATKAIAELLEASPEEQQKAYGVLLSNRQVLANLYQSEFDNQTEMATNTLRSANPLGLSAGSRVFLVATLLVIGFVRELARYH